MSQGATETGQDPANGGAGGAGQEPPANGSQGQEPEGGQGQNGGATPPPPNGIDLDTITDPALRSYVEAQQAAAREAREQAARYRTERNTHQQTLADLQRQNETAEQTAQREAEEARQARETESTRLQELERENRDLRVGHAVTEAARDARAHNPAIVAQMLNPRVTVGDDGKPQNVQALLEELRTQEPYLFRRTRSDAGEGAGDEGADPSTGGINDVIRGQVNARRGRPTT